MSLWKSNIKKNINYLLNYTFINICSSAKSFQVQFYYYKILCFQLIYIT